MTWMKWMGFALGLLGAAAFCAAAFGSWRWQKETASLRARLESARTELSPSRYSESELEGLPAPVQRYFRAVLRDGQPIIAAARLKHSGTFNMGETDDQWKPFTSDQRVLTRRPGFVWDARIMMLPGVPVHVHDAYVAGEGILRGAVFGLVAVLNMAGTPEMARGELLRFFAETAWYPTALLPSQGVRWEAVDVASARGTLTDGKLAVTLLFRFDDGGLIDTVRAEARDRVSGGKTVSAPWQGRFWNYAGRDGMRVPLDGEVAWLMPEGDRPYWRGSTTTLSYDFAK